jgi:hypothetical protein
MRRGQAGVVGWVDTPKVLQPPRRLPVLVFSGRGTFARWRLGPPYLTLGAPATVRIDYAAVRVSL